MGVHKGISRSVIGVSHAPKVDTSPTTRQRFINITPMESAEITYCTSIPRLQFLTGLRELASRVDQKVLRQFGHMERMDENSLARRVLTAAVSGRQV